MATLTPFTGVLHSDRLGKDFNVCIIHCGLIVKIGDDKKRYPQDRWLVNLSVDHVTESFDYYTGIGHRKPLRVAEGWRQARATKICLGMELKQTDENFDMAVEELGKGSTAVFPKIDDVLCCLMTDAAACDMGFEDWCHEFGYDTDSRRAYATYEACKANGEKCRRLGIGTDEDREEFNDY